MVVSHEKGKPSLRANGSRERAPDDRLREAIQLASSATNSWIASRRLSSGARSRDPLARNDGEGSLQHPRLFLLRLFDQFLADHDVAAGYQEDHGRGAGDR